jgi:CDP-glucose 4,6-dehydratase
VLEPLRGYLQLARALTDGHHGACAEGWNFGPGEADAVPVRDVVAMLQQHWPSVRMVHERDDNTPHEAGLLALDASKAAARLDWTPVLGLPQALEWTARWYREFFDGERAASALVADELARYAALVERQAAQASERDSIQVQP